MIASLTFGNVNLGGPSRERDPIQRRGTSPPSSPRQWVITAKHWYRIV